MPKFGGIWKLTFCHFNRFLSLPKRVVSNPPSAVIVLLRQTALKEPFLKARTVNFGDPLKSWAAYLTVSSWADTNEAGNVVRANARKQTINFNEPKRIITNKIPITTKMRVTLYSETKLRQLRLEKFSGSCRWSKLSTSQSKLKNYLDVANLISL